MSLWSAVLIAAVLAYGTKLAGHVVPAHWLQGARAARVTAALPIALLAALVVTQTLTGPHGTLVLDARIIAVGVAVTALALRAPFIVVVVLAAVVAAVVRSLGWG